MKKALFLLTLGLSIFSQNYGMQAFKDLIFVPNPQPTQNYQWGVDPRTNPTNGKDSPGWNMPTSRIDVTNEYWCKIPIYQTKVFEEEQIDAIGNGVSAASFPIRRIHPWIKITALTLTHCATAIACYVFRNKLFNNNQS